MSRPKVGNFVRKHISLDADDAEWLLAIYGARPGFSEAIRRIIRVYRQHVEAKAMAVTRPLRTEIEDLDI